MLHFESLIKLKPISFSMKLTYCTLNEMLRSLNFYARSVLILSDKPYIQASEKTTIKSL